MVLEKVAKEVTNEVVKEFTKEVTNWENQEVAEVTNWESQEEVVKEAKDNWNINISFLVITKCPRKGLRKVAV